MDVIVVGSIVVDLINYVEKFPSIGETVLGYKFSKGFGGKGANQCVMSKFLGAKSLIIGKVGDDEFGQEYIRHLKNLSINTDYICINPASSTGVAAITVRKDDGANQIVITPGANFTVSISDIEKAKDIILMSKVVVCQLEIPLQATYHSLRIAKENNVLTIFNPAPIPDCGLDLSEMPPVDIFCPNESEASLVTGIQIKTVEDAIEAIKYFFLHFSDKVRWPMITLGHLGVVYGESENKTIHFVPAPTVNAIDSTGAGDCFIGSLAYYFGKCSDVSLNEKIKRSVFLASKSVEKLGTQTSFPNELDNLDFQYSNETQ